VLREALRACNVDIPSDEPLHHDLSWLPPFEDPQEAGGTGVPFFVFDGKWALSGAHPPAVLLQGLRHALEQRALTA
jgi:hypothetical protein